MADLDERVLQLEKQLNRVFGGVVVAIVLLLGFFGFASFYQIPAAAKSAVPDAVEKYVGEMDPGLIDRIRDTESQIASSAAAAAASEEAAKHARDELGTILAEAKSNAGLLRAEIGKISVHKNGISSLLDGSGKRGEKTSAVTFSKPFVSVPKVVVGLTKFDLINGPNHRLRVEINEITKKGFTYTFVTWGNTKLWSAEASWVAVGN